MSITQELHDHVLRRDGCCVISFMDRSHTCRDRWGEEHDPTVLGRLTLEHVRTDPGGMRRHDPGHIVAMCWHANVVEHWGSTTEHRLALNIYLRGIRAAAGEPGTTPAGHVHEFTRGPSGKQMEQDDWRKACTCGTREPVEAES